MRKRSRKGFTLVEIMIVVAIIALLAAIAIPNLLRARINANEAAAQATLKSFSAACEAYASANNGNYPSAATDLTGATPPYFGYDLDGFTKGGFGYAVNYDAGGYTVTATRVSAQTANNCYRITTGAVLERDAACAGSYTAQF